MAWEARRSILARWFRQSGEGCNSWHICKYFHIPLPELNTNVIVCTCPHLMCAIPTPASMPTWSRGLMLCRIVRQPMGRGAGCWGGQRSIPGVLMAALRLFLLSSSDVGIPSLTLSSVRVWVRFPQVPITVKGHGEASVRGCRPIPLWASCASGTRSPSFVDT